MRASWMREILARRRRCRRISSSARRRSPASRPERERNATSSSRSSSCSSSSRSSISSMSSSTIRSLSRRCRSLSSITSRTPPLPPGPALSFRCALCPSVMQFSSASTHVSTPFARTWLPSSVSDLATQSKSSALLGAPPPPSRSFRSSRSSSSSSHSMRTPSQAGPTSCSTTCGESWQTEERKETTRAWMRGWLEVARRRRRRGATGPSCCMSGASTASQSALARRAKGCTKAASAESTASTTEGSFFSRNSPSCPSCAATCRRCATLVEAGVEMKSESARIAGCRCTADSFPLAPGSPALSCEISISE
mmetsp:Transcript_2894/g.6770  ORF Transcript_2894/g.6770 Transcript_2894/m.6770 type:complete len:310 (-) Transcript_2894:940-1869(-)